MTTHPLDLLEPRRRSPKTVRALETWIQQAERRVGIGGGRLGWMVASAIVLAALQRVRHDDGHPRLLVKGGTYLELRLGLRARATRDLDALFRGDFHDFVRILDETLAEPLDGFTFQRTEIETAERVRGRLIKPRRLAIKLQVRGRTWRSIDVEVAADEGSAGQRVDLIRAPSLAHFGFEGPPTIAGIVVDYQIAQKLHACTEPHNPPDFVNDRARDLTDLLLLKRAFYQEDEADLIALRKACVDLFAARAAEARQMGGVETREWPPTLIGYNHWRIDYASYQQEIGLEISFDEAVEALNAWVAAIDGAGS